MLEKAGFEVEKGEQRSRSDRAGHAWPTFSTSSSFGAQHVLRLTIRLSHGRPTPRMHCSTMADTEFGKCDQYRLRSLRSLGQGA
jgi:hypothetical protein